MPAQGSEQTPPPITLCQGFFLLINNFGKHKGLFTLSLPVVEVSPSSQYCQHLEFYFLCVLYSFCHFVLLSNEFLAVFRLRQNVNLPIPGNLFFFSSLLWPTLFSEQHIQLIIFFPQSPSFFFVFFVFFHLVFLHTAKPTLALHWGAREETKKKLVQEIFFFFFHFKRCAKFMMRVQNGNYQAVCLPLAVWFSVVICVYVQFVAEM